MSTKKRGLGKGVDALFPAEAVEPSEVPEKGDFVDSKVEDKSSKLEVSSSDVEVRSSQVKTPDSQVIELEDKSSELKVKSSKVEDLSSKLEDISYNQDAMKVAIREADKNPRITLWSPVSTAMLKYLRKTIPEFSISEEASHLLEEAIVRKYPDLYEGLRREKDRDQL